MLCCARRSTHAHTLTLLPRVSWEEARADPTRLFPLEPESDANLGAAALRASVGTVETEVMTHQPWIIHTEWFI